MRVFKLHLPLLLVALALTACAKWPEGPNANGWRLLPGRVEGLSYAPFRSGRQCWVYLPPGYATSARRYPVLYVNDGEYAFDRLYGGMRINRICEDLIRRVEIEPIIVVAIETAGRRYLEYVPAEEGDLYLRTIRDTLKPEIDRRYRTLTDSRNTAMTGGSLGGLISVYAGFAYDSTFGKVAGFSPSYGWWPGYEGFVRARGRPRFLVRFYQDTGYPRDNSIRDMEALPWNKASFSVWTSCP